MSDALKLLSIIFVPVVGAFLLPFIGPLSRRVRNILALGFVLVSLVFSLIIFSSVFKGQIITFCKYLPFGFNLSFVADKLAVFMAIVSSFISSIIILYSFSYIEHYKNQNEYYFMVVLFLGSMMGLVFSSNLILLYLFWELTAITSWRLIGFFRGKDQILRADKAFLVTVFGAVLMLLGFVIIYQKVGSFELVAIKEAFKSAAVPTSAVLLILAGILSKSATLPFHTWLPDAGVAPSPVTALLHAAILVKIGVYVFARLFIVTFFIPDNLYLLVKIIAAASALIAAGAAFIDKDIKRIIAYSTISQIGFIFLGLSSQNEIGFAGALLFILMHGIAKAGLFLCAGIVEQNTKEKDITKLGGLINTMPVTAESFLFCAFSVMGIPPFGGFFSKYMVFSSAMTSGHLFIALAFLVGAFLTILYLFRVFNMVFLGEQKISGVKEGSKVMVICVALLALFSLLSGILINYPNSIVQSIAQQVTVAAL